jgi:hypothetical protein
MAQYRFQWILDEIRAGKTYPPRWPDKPEKKKSGKKPAGGKGAKSATKKG